MENIYRSDVQVFSFTVISEVYRSFIWIKTTVTKYCLTQWISQLTGSFEIHWVRQYLVKCMGVAGIVNAIVYMTEPIFTSLRHAKLPNFVTLYKPLTVL